MIHEPPNSAPFRRALALAVVLPPSLLAALAAVFLGLIAHLLAVTARVDRCNRLLAQVHRVEVELVDVEYWLRSYLATGSPAHLDYYNETSRTVVGWLDATTLMLEGEPTNANRLASIRVQTARWKKLADEKVKSRPRREGLPPAGGPMDGDRSNMEQIRNQLWNVIRAEEATRNRLGLEARRTTATVVGAGLAVSILLGAALAVGSRRQLLRVSSDYEEALEVARRQAEAIREGEAVLRSFYDSASMIMGVAEVVDDDVVIVDMNAAGARLLGLPPEAVRGRRLRDLGVTEETAARSLDVCREAIRSGKPARYESHRDGDDGVRWFSNTFCRLDGEAAGRPRLSYVTEEITAERRAEQERAEALRERQAIMDTVPDILYTLDLDERLVRWNRAYETAAGLSAEVLQGRPWLDRIAPEDRAVVVEAILRAYQTGYAEVEGRLLRVDGPATLYQWTGVPLRDARGEVVGLTGVGRDITERKRAEAALRESRERLLAALIASGTGTFRWDIRTGDLDWDDQLARLFGLDSGDQVRRLDHFLERVHPDDRPAVAAASDGASTRGTDFDMEFRIVRPDGEVRWLADKGRTYADDSGEPAYMTGGCVDITDQKQSEALMAHQASHDALTGLPNRSLLGVRTGAAIASARAAGGSVGLILIDLDRFKEINDTFGHHYGDMVLGELAARLRAALRDADLVARLGGDEFAVLLPDADRATAIQIAERLHTDLCRPIDVEGRRLDVGASLGIALYPEHGDDANSLLQYADVAMYAAKRSHGGHAVYTAEQSPYSPRRLSLIAELRRGIDEGQLRLHYQPKVDLRTGRVRGAEALVRWAHPEEGLIPPGLFIPLAEHTGLIRPLGLWALRTAFRQALEWSEAGLDLDIAVNLAPANLLDPLTCETISSLIRDAGGRPPRLTVEVTESAMMEDPDRARDVLARLHEQGVRISIDDFGTGYSSLAYLKDLPADEVKIDRTFVRDMIDDKQAACITRAVIDLGHNLGLRVVAEGIEDRKTRDLLASWGCDVAQGFFFCRPMPADEVPGWIEQSTRSLAVPRAPERLATPARPA